MDYYKIFDSVEYQRNSCKNYLQERWRPTAPLSYRKACAWLALPDEELFVLGRFEICALSLSVEGLSASARQRVKAKQARLNFKLQILNTFVDLIVCQQSATAGDLLEEQIVRLAEENRRLRAQVGAVDGAQ